MLQILLLVHYGNENGEGGKAPAHLASNAYFASEPFLHRSSLVGQGRVNALSLLRLLMGEG